ncbi:MAG: glycosyltransferase family 4 protein [bacterium]|nr:glycosyltransferase family 4 protein [bacterium]
MENKEFKLIIFSLTPEPVGYDGKTGGEVRLIEIIQRLNDSGRIESVIVSTDYGAEYFRRNGIFAEFKIVRTKLKFRNLFGLCLKSLFIIAKSFFAINSGFLKSNDQRVIIYSSSDLFWEVIPAFIYKVRNKRIEWVQLIMHLYPDWKKRPGRKIVSLFGYYLQKFSHFLIKKKADKIILINSLAREDLSKRGFNPKKTYVSSVGIDFNCFDKLEKAAISYDGVFLGRLSASKGVADFIPIWKKVCDKIPEAKLAIIGGAERNAKADFIQKIKLSGLEKNIDVLGFLKNEKAYSILKSGKVFLFPSHEEGWGIAIAEAMACGLPVVSWDLPGYREIFENYIFQIKENDIKLLSDSVLRLLINEGYRKEISDKGKEFIKKYSWEEAAKRELEIIKNLRKAKVAVD